MESAERARTPQLPINLYRVSSRSNDTTECFRSGSRKGEGDTVAEGAETGEFTRSAAKCLGLLKEEMQRRERESEREAGKKKERDRQ